MKKYYHELQEPIEREAEELLSETLNDRLTSDLAQNIADDVVQIEQCGTAVRYVLIDAETGQLESRRLYEEYDEVERDAHELFRRHERSCLVGMLLYER
jgi:hypothetical protein